MPVVYSPERGELLVTDTPEEYYARGYREPTDEELDHAEGVAKYGGLGQQAQAQGERVIRGATLGAVPGFGSTEDIQGREEVSREEHPILSFAADVAPDVGVAALTGGLGGLATGAGRAAARSAVAGGAGVLKAGLSAARAGGATALAAESLGTGLVGAGQAAHAEGSYLGEDLGRDAENVLLWGGLNFGLGAFGLRAAKRAGKVTAEAAEETVGELDDVARAAELDAVAKGAPADELAAEAAPAAAPATSTVDDLSRQFNEMTGLTPRAPESPVDLTGKSLQDLGALHDSGFREDSFAALRSSDEFAATGRTPKDFSRSDYEHGIRLRQGEPGEGREWYLVDGRHRLTVAREKGRSTVWGTVYDTEGEQIFRGEIPIANLPAADVATAAEKRVAQAAAAEEGLSRAVRAASKADAEDIVKGAIGEAAEREASGFGRQRRLYQNRVAVMDAAEREFRGDLNGAMADLQRVVKGEKQAVVSAKVSANEGAQRAVASAIGKEAAEFAGALRGEARAFAKRFGKTGIQFPIPAAKSLSVALMDNASALAKAKNGKALFAALDDFKRSAQDFKLSLEQGALNSTNPIHHQQLIPRIDTFERKIRDALEDSNTWGQAGEMQRAYNGVISDKLMPSLRIFEESVMERTHRGYDGIWKMEGWENKIKGLLANTDPGRRRHAAAVFDAMDELASVRRQFGDAKTAERLSTAAGKMRRTIGLADEVAEASKTVEDLGTVAGAVPLFGGMIREAVTGRLASAVERLTGASDAAATRGVDDWIRSSRARGGGLRAKLPKLSELSPEAKQLRDAAVRRGVSQGMALFMGEDESPSAAFERQRDALINDEAFFESLSNEYGDVQQESPELFMALSGRAALARGFLLERMPANVAVSMARPLGHPPSREAIEDWAQYVNAVRYPTRIASNLAAISVQQVETLRTVHPRFYELLQQRMIEGLSRAQQTGEPLDDTFLMRIGLLFPDLDGAASPVFSREFGKVVRDYNQQQRQQQGQKAGAGKPGKPTPSPMLSTLQNGATFGTGF